MRTVEGMVGGEVRKGSEVRENRGDVEMVE